MSNVTLVSKAKRTKQYNLSQVSTKIKKCHSEARDRPDLIQTAPVPGGSLARTQNKRPGHSPVTARSSSGHSPVTALVTQVTSNVTTVFHFSLAKSVKPVTSKAVRSSQVSDFHFISSKRRNNLIKQSNGNGKKSLSVCHWNLGAKLWKNKRNQIQALADQLSPDIIFISEANLDDLSQPHESQITGYDITLPKTVIRSGTARLALLTRDNLDFEIKEDLMDDIFTSIWLKISRPGTKGLLVCGLYREHQYLNQDSDWSLHPSDQNKR